MDRARNELARSRRTRTIDMKTKFTKVITVLGAVAAFGVTSSLAVPQVTMSTFDAGSGGNYRANPNDELEWVLANYANGKSTDGTWFGTFCIEFNEYFHSGGVYDVALNNGSIMGGVSGAVNGKDVISNGTAYLYEQFALGTLAGFNYGDTNLDSVVYDSAKQLQNTIWYLEGEITSAYYGVGFGSFLGLAQSQLDYASDYVGGAVKVMNLTSNNGHKHHQDQLVYAGVPDSGTTVSLLLVAVCGLVGARRKLARSK